MLALVNGFRETFDKRARDIQEVSYAGSTVYKGTIGQSGRLRLALSVPSNGENSLLEIIRPGENSAADKPLAVFIADKSERGREVAIVNHWPIDRLLPDRAQQSEYFEFCQTFGTILADIAQVAQAAQLETVS